MDFQPLVDAQKVKLLKNFRLMDLEVIDCFNPRFAFKRCFEIQRRSTMFYIEPDKNLEKVRHLFLIGRRSLEVQFKFISLICGYSQHVSRIIVQVISNVFIIKS